MEDGPVRIEPGNPVTRKVSERGTHEYRVPLEKGQLVEVVAEQRGVDVALRLLDPNGNVLIEVDSPNGSQGPERASFVADEAQELWIQVVAERPETEPGEYEMRVEVRAAVPEDGVRVQAERVFAEGEGLRRGDRWEEANSRYEKSVELWRSIGDKAGEAAALYRSGWMHHQLGSWKRASERYARSLPLFRELGDRTSEGNLLNRRGHTLLMLGDYDEALDSHSRAAVMGQETRDVELQASALTNLGTVHNWSGRTQEAADAFDAALVLWRQLGDQTAETRTLLNLGRLYLEWGQRENVQDAYGEALALAERTGDRESLAVALSTLGELDHREGRFDQAQEMLEKALGIHQEIQDRRGEAIALNSLGTAFLKAGKLEQARACYEKALTIFQELGDRSSQASALSGLGRYEHGRGAHQEALQRHQQALESFEQLGDRAGMALAHFGCGRALANLGDLEAARQHLESSLGFVESLRQESGSLELRTSFFASKQHYWDLYVDVLFRLHQKYPLAGYDALAFQAGERRRFRSLLEALAGFRRQIQSGVASDLVARESELEHRLDRIERNRMEASEAKDGAIKIQELEREFRGVLAELDRVRAKMLQDSQRHRELVQPRIPTLEEVQSRLLAPGTLLLAFSLGEERSFLWAVSRRSFDVHVLAGRQQIEAAAVRLQDLLVRSGASARESRERAAADLAEVVLAPAARAIGGFNRLVIIADGALLRVPFAALPEPGREAQPLIVEHEIVYLPSASVLYTLQERSARPTLPRTSPHRVAVIADPVFSAEDPRVSGAPGGGVTTPLDLRRSLRDLGLSGLERLPYTRREAEEILKLFKDDERFAAFDFEAARELVTGQQLKTYPVLHFATHGLLDDRHPELSGLVFSLIDPEGRPRRGFLRLHEIYNLDLGAELVVLSACQTGVGREIRGEGLLSLTRGFMYAGVPRVVMSLWKVEDRSTAELMSRFYFQLLEKGKLPAAALRYAQISMWHDQDWSDPVHWAGFIFQGDYGEIPGGIETRDSGGTNTGNKASNDLPIPPPPKRSRYGLTGRLNYFNGVDGATGRYLTPPMTASELAELAGRECLANLVSTRLSPEIVDYLARLLGAHGFVNLRRAPIANLERPWDLSETGWGVIFGPEVKANVKDEVRVLLEHRRDQAGRKNRLVKVEEYHYVKGETTADFLRRHGVNPSLADTERFPFYLLLVGDPESLPYTFQYELDVQYAVGRIHFETVEQYRAYVQSVIRAERRPLRRSRQLAFFGTRNEDDSPTQRTASELLEPLAATVLEPGMEWEVRRVLGAEATKCRLKRLLGGDETPGLLFIGTHGLGFAEEDGRQGEEQGALVCQDWRGPDAGINQDQYFSAADLGDDASVSELIAFLLACHSAGTPVRDNFSVRPLGKPMQIAPASFVSRLPQRLLSHPRGGALAVVGHVDRVWTTSFAGPEHCDVYRSCLRDLLRGHTLGWSMQLFDQSHAALTAQLDYLWQGLQWREDVDLEWLAWLWGTSNNARNFVVFGDPAVRLPGAPTPRPLGRR